MTRQAVKSRLGPAFSRFADQWRDETSTAPNLEYRQLWLAGEHLGHLYGPLCQQVPQAMGDVGLGCRQNGEKVELVSPVDEIEDQLQALAIELQSRGLIPGWRDEAHMLYDSKGLPICKAERALFKILGLCSQALHIHAETGNGLIWLGIRDQSKHENPGMLDNLAAGGIGAGEALLDCAVRELEEEAGLTDPGLIQDGVFPAGFTSLKACLNDPANLLTKQNFQIRVSRPVEHGWHHELIYLFYMKVPAAWVPGNLDGEVGGFALTTRQACIDIVNNWQMTPDAALVTALALSA